MWKVLLYSTIFIVATGVLSPLLAQLDSTRYINGLTNRYRVEYYKSSVAIQNMANKLKKPNHSPDMLSMKGLQLKSFHDSLTIAIQNLFSENKWSNLPKGCKIAVELGVLKSGKIAELLLLVLPSNITFSGTDTEQLESLVKDKSITVVDSSLYSKVNFMPLFFTVNPVK